MDYFGSGKWSFTLHGSDKKKKVEYFVISHKKGLQESDTHGITVTNPNYVTHEKKEKAHKPDTSNKNNNTSDRYVKTSKKDDKAQSFEDDINGFLQNQYPEVSFSYSPKSSTAKFIVPDAVAYMSKSALKAYATPIYKRIELFSNTADLDNEPYMLMQTQDGNEVSRSGILGGAKIYVSK